MTNANKQDRWLDVKDAMHAPLLTLGVETSAALDRDPESLILGLSFYKLAAKLIGPGKRVLVSSAGEGLGTWVLAKECGFALGLEQNPTALASAQANFKATNVRFESPGSALPADAWQAIVRYAADNPLPGDFVEQAAVVLGDAGMLVLGATDADSVLALREVLERRFHHTFVFHETLGITPLAAAPNAGLAAVVGCRPRRA